MSQVFVAGEFFKNKERWQNAVAAAKENGSFVPQFLEEAISGDGVDVRHKSFTNESARNVKFRGYQFGSKEALLKKNFQNSRSIQRNIDQVLTEIELLLSCNAIEEVSREQAFEEGSIISPILWVTQKKPNGKTKTRLIHHDLLNYQYSRPKFTLTDISAELDVLAEFFSIKKHDLEKAFYQCPVTKASSKTLRFSIKVNGEVKYYQWLVLCMGISAAPFIMQCSGWLVTETFSRTYNVYISLFIDDAWLDGDKECPDFADWASEFGLRFRKDKSEHGEEIVILGLLLNLRNKTARVTADKAAAIAQDGKLMLESKSATPKQLATFYGRIDQARL